MATGNPKTTWRAGFGRGNPKPRAAANSSVLLSYDGKGDSELQLALEVVPIWRFGEQKPDGEGNRLYFGDNLPLLMTLVKDPSVRGKVRLIYIDPPYATNSVFHSRSLRDAYADLLTGPAYLEFLRVRLLLLAELLAKDGSIYVHLDENMAFPAKVLMD